MNRNRSKTVTISNIDYKYFDITELSTDGYDIHTLSF